MSTIRQSKAPIAECNRLCARYASALLAMALPLAGLAATDEHIECEVLDPEFHDDLDMIVYQHIDVQPGPTITQQAIVQYVDPDDNGSLIEDTDGVLAEDLASYMLSNAGPKFATGVDASEQPEILLAYTRAVGSDLVAGLRKYDPTAGDCEFGTEPADNCFPTPDLNGQIPDTGDIGDEDRSFVYTTEEEALDYRAYAIYNFQDAGTPALNGLRWAVAADWLPTGSEGESAFVDSEVHWARLGELKTGSGANDRLLKAVTTYDAGGTWTQVFLHDVADPDNVDPIQVTSGAGVKFNPYVFFNADPDDVYDTNMVVFRKTPASNPLQSDIVIWYETSPGSDTWQQFMTITAEDLGEDDEDRNFLLSPETFTYNGKTYVIFSSSDTQTVSSQTDGNIWIARVKTGTLSAIQLNSDAAGGASQGGGRGVLPELGTAGVLLLPCHADR